jgi:hypothetical protein
MSNIDKIQRRGEYWYRLSHYLPKRSPEVINKLQSKVLSYNLVCISENARKPLHHAGNRDTNLCFI